MGRKPHLLFMCVDRRYPELVRIDVLDDAIRSQVERVCSRAMCNALYNRRYNEVHFYYSDDPSFGVWQQQVTRNPWPDVLVDEIVGRIGAARKSARVKDRWVSWAKKDAEHDRREALHRDTVDKAPEYVSAVRYNKERRGMGRHYRPSAVVSGGAVNRKRKG